MNAPFHDGKVKYINPFTDYGFKRLFGEPPSKALLLDFLNELLKDKEGEIKDLQYLPTENLPLNIGNRKAIFDIYCTNDKGEHFIVEMQKAEQRYFKDRMVFYSTFPIQSQAKDKGVNWDFKLQNVYTIGILDFVFRDDNEAEDQYLYEGKVTNQHSGKVMFDSPTYIFLVMPKFKKQLHELQTKFDKWLYVLKNIERLDRIPEKIQEKIFSEFFRKAEIAKLDQQEYRQYQGSLNAYRDMKNVVDWALTKGSMLGEEVGYERGREEGREEGEKQKAIEVAKKLKQSGLDADFIAASTGLRLDEIDNL